MSLAKRNAGAEDYPTPTTMVRAGCPPTRTDDRREIPNARSLRGHSERGLAVGSVWRSFRLNRCKFPGAMILRNHRTSTPRSDLPDENMPVRGPFWTREEELYRARTEIVHCLHRNWNAVRLQAALDIETRHPGETNGAPHARPAFSFTPIPNLE